MAIFRFSLLNDFILITIRSSGKNVTEWGRRPIRLSVWGQTIFSQLSKQKCHDRNDPRIRWRFKTRLFFRVILLHLTSGQHFRLQES